VDTILIRIFSAEGKELIRKQFAESGNHQMVTNSLPEGLYILLWESEKKSGAVKLLKNF
jgi:hypothetical protein